MRYLYVALAFLCFVAGYGLAVWVVQEMAAGDLMSGILLIASAVLIYGSRWLYWRYEKPSVDAWQG